MKLAWICSHVPWPAMSGGSLRVHHLIRQAAIEHEVHVLCLDYDKCSPQPPAATCTSAISVMPNRPKRKAQIKSLLGSHCSYYYEYESDEAAQWLEQHKTQIDAVVLDSTQVSWIPVPPGIPRILATHNIEFELQARTAQSSTGIRKWFRGRDAKQLEHDEKRSYADADMIWVCSQREKDAISEWLPNKSIVVVANGVDHELVQPGQAPDDFDGPELVFVAAMHYAPNEDAAIYLVNEIWPELRKALPGKRLGLIGGRPGPRVTALAKDDVHIHPMVDSVIPYYHAADMSLVPLRAGSGTRLKILEAAAAGSPVVSTSLGAEGINVIHEKHCLLADNITDFVAACVQTLDSPEATKARCELARQLVCTEYSWDTAGKVMRTSLAEL